MTQKNIAYLLAVLTSIALFGIFLQTTGWANGHLIIIIISLSLLYPFAGKLEESSVFTRRLITIIALTFSLWILSEVALILFPFFVAFILAYLLDPIASWLATKKISRTFSALVVVLIALGILVSISIFVFPVVYGQLNQIIKQISSLVTNVTTYIESRQFFRLLASYGIPIETVKDVVRNEISPRIEGTFSAILKGFLSFLTNLSTVVTQVINVILIPILLFYFLRDFDKLKNFITKALLHKNDKLLVNLHRINSIIRAYAGGQAIAALLVGSGATISFAAFGLPYAGFLGVLCGLLNPIPYIGMFSNVIIGAVTLLVANTNDFAFQISVVGATVIILHFLDTYFLQPRIVGQRIGLHPLVLIASLFVFGYFFGLVGLLLSVPTTAVLMMFLNDWIEGNSSDNKSIDNSLLIGTENSEFENNTSNTA